MIPLYLKELRTLVPLQILLILTNSGDVLYRPLVERLDEQAWTDISSYIEPGEGAALGVGLMILALLVAFSLLPREHEERTIEFLYSLPVSRWRIFLAKAAAGATVLVVGCVVLQVTDGLLQSPNRQSYLGEQWRLGLAAQMALLQSAFALCVLCHGLLLSFWRRLGLIPYAIAGWIILSLERVSPSFAPLNMMNLLALEYEGRRLVMPWDELALHGAVALAAFFAAFALWMGRGEWFTALWERLRRRAWGKLSLGCATVMVVVAFTGLVLSLWGGEEMDRLDEPGQAPPERSFQRATATTERFEFTYPDNLRGRAQVLIAEADRLHERLRARLGAEEGDRVVVDLTEQSPHHEGITAWTTMRVGLVGEPDDARLRRIFVHELVHAFQFQLTDRRLADNGRAVRFFAEGSAEYYAQELVPDAQARRALRRTAVASWRRHQVRFQTLADDVELTARLDPLLVYTLGESWTAALVEACGPEAPGRVLRAIGRSGAPRDLAPPAFWRDTMQAAECDLEQVLGVWEGLLAEEAEAEADFLEALPRLGGGVVGSDGSMVRVLATLDRPPRSADDGYLLRARDDPSVGVHGLRSFQGRTLPGDGRQVEFEVPRSLTRGERFQVQLGVKFDPHSWAYFEPWQDLEVPPRGSR